MKLGLSALKITTRHIQSRINWRSKTTEEIKVYSGSGNVSADLGLINPDELQIKAELAHQISELISDRKLTQIEAADFLGIDQPKVSALVRSKLSGFSTEHLFRFLNTLGSNVEIRVTPNARPTSKLASLCYRQGVSRH